MSTVAIILFIFSVICDVLGQIAFKIGADRLHEADPSLGGFLRGLLKNQWVLLGVATHAIEFFIWLRILAEVPLSLAFPLASVNILGVVLASRVVLGEAVTRRRWIGAAIVTAGVVMVASTTT